MGGRRWINEENEYLKTNWGNLKIDTICKTLGRTKRAVEEQAYIKLKLGAQASWYTLLEVEAMTGINKDTIRKNIIKYNLSHKRGKTIQKPYMLTEDNVREFLCKCPHLWNYYNLKINFWSGRTPAWLEEKIITDKENYKSKNKRWTELEDSILLDRFNRGYAFEDIAKEVNKDAESVYKRLRYKYNY